MHFSPSRLLSTQLTVVMMPAPMVRPPSRSAKRMPASMPTARWSVKPTSALWPGTGDATVRGQPSRLRNLPVDGPATAGLEDLVGVREQMILRDGVDERLAVER